jgi:hypothetical protein
MTTVIITLFPDGTTKAVNVPAGVVVQFETSDIDQHGNEVGAPFALFSDDEGNALVEEGVTWVEHRSVLA